MGNLAFQLSGDGKILQAVCSDADANNPIDEAWVKKGLDDAGFSNLYLFNNVCAELVRRYNSATGPFTMDIGELRDGTFSLAIAADLLTAGLTITPPYGGKAVTSEEIYEALAKEQVTSGINHESITAAVKACRALNKPIASGTPPIAGKDGQLLSLIPEIRERCPLIEDESSTVDYRELGGIISVKPGAPLMRRVPPTSGTPGEDILGHVIPPPPGREATFAQGLSGAEISPDDPDLLISSIGGQPVLVTNGVMVEPTINLKNIDLSTGNLSFEGTVIVSGDVAAGMTVKASGDIIVSGTVESALLEAGGSIEAKGGVIFSMLHAKGEVTARFAERSHIHTEGNILIRELSMQSELKAGGRITVGEKGMRKGHLIGGLCRAATIVHAIVIGSPAGVPTVVEVGIDPSAREKLAVIRKELEVKRKEAEEAEKSLAYICENPGRVPAAAVRLREERHRHLQSEVMELSGQEKRLQRRLETVGNARVEVERNIFFGVQLSIGDKTMVVDDDLEEATFRIEDEKIVH